MAKLSTQQGTSKFWDEFVFDLEGIILFLWIVGFLALLFIGGLEFFDGIAKWARYYFGY